MTWYMAVLVRGSFVDGTLDEERLGDKLFRLIEAPDAEMAYRRAVELGYHDFRYMREDRDLDSIRHDPRFRKLLQEYENR